MNRQFPAIWSANWLKLNNFFSFTSRASKLSSPFHVWAWVFFCFLLCKFNFVYQIKETFSNILLSLSLSVCSGTKEKKIMSFWAYQIYFCFHHQFTIPATYESIKHAFHPIQRSQQKKKRVQLNSFYANHRSNGAGNKKYMKGEFNSYHFFSCSLAPL